MTDPARDLLDALRAASTHLAGLEDRYVGMIAVERIIGEHFARKPAPASGELLPCPFCGGDAELVWSSDDARDDCWIACGICGCMGIAEPDERRASAAWNRRAPLAPQDKEARDE